MSTTTPAQKTVTTDEQTADEYVLERRSWNYGYIGEDNNSHYHHIDRQTNRILVTEHDRERIADAVPQFRVRGPVVRIEDLDDHDGKDVDDWVAFVERGPVGWADRPVSPVDTLADVLTELVEDD